MKYWIPTDIIYSLAIHDNWSCKMFQSLNPCGVKTIKRSPIYARFFPIADLASSSVSNSATASPLGLNLENHVIKNLNDNLD